MPEDKPDLAKVAEALGGAPAAAAPSKEDSQFDKDRAAFDAIEKKYRNAEPAEKPKAEKKAQPKEAEPKGDAPEAEQEGNLDAETSESKKAREFLRLKANVPQNVIDTLSTEEAVDWHSQVARRESEVDRTYRELAELRKQQSETTETAKEEAAVPALDLEGVTTRLADQFGEEESKVLAEVLRETVEPFQTRIASLESTIESAKENNTREITDTNRERLSEYVPLLSESDRAWAAVEREVIALAEKDPAAFGNAEGFFDDAIKALYGDDAFERKVNEPEPEPESAEEEEEKVERKKATPTTKSKRSPHRKPSPQESDWQVFKHLERTPGDIRGAQRAGHVKTA